MSPALSYTSKHLHSDVDKEKKEKLPKEYEEDRIKREEEKKGILEILVKTNNCSCVSPSPPTFLHTKPFTPQRQKRGRTQ